MIECLWHTSAKKQNRSVADCVIHCESIYPARIVLVVLQACRWRSCGRFPFVHSAPGRQSKFWPSCRCFRRSRDWSACLNPHRTCTTCSLRERGLRRVDRSRLAGRGGCGWVRNRESWSKPVLLFVISLIRKQAVRVTIGRFRLLPWEQSIFSVLISCGWNVRRAVTSKTGLDLKHIQRTEQILKNFVRDELSLVPARTPPSPPAFMHPNTPTAPTPIWAGRLVDTCRPRQPL